jgi:hypothetical protein
VVYKRAQTGQIWGQSRSRHTTLGRAGEFAAITSVSCTSAGNCSAVGYYQDSSLDLQAFVDSET